MTHRAVSGWDHALDAQNRLRETGWVIEALDDGKRVPSDLRPFRSNNPPTSGPLKVAHSRITTADQAAANHELLKNAAHAALLGDPMWVSRDVCRLVTAAAESFRSEALYPDDVFAPYVFAYLEEPFGYDYVDGRIYGSARLVTWARSQIDDNPGDAGLVLAFWGHKDESVGSGFSLHYSGYVSFGDDAMGIVGEADNPEAEWTRGFFSWMQVLWRLAQQEIVTMGRRDVARSVWRHKRNRPREIKTVQVLTLRHVKAQRHDDEPADVEWSHRWGVRGHWRNQWYPKLHRHCQIWIDPYVKGPDDKPFVAKRQAIDFVR